MNNYTLQAIIILVTIILALVISFFVPAIFSLYLVLSVLFAIIAWNKTLPTFIGYVLLTPIYLIFARNLFNNNFTLVSALKDIIFVVLFIIVAIKMVKNKDFSKLKTPLTLPIIFLCFVGTISLLFSQDIIAGLRGIRIWIEFVPIFFMTLVLVKKEHLSRILMIIILCAAIIATTGIIQYLLFPKTTYACLQGACIQRMGTFYHGPPFEGNARGSNEFAIYLLLSFMIVSTLFLEKSFKRRIYLFPALVLYLIGIIFSLSRKVWIGLLLAFVLLTMLSYKRAVIYIVPIFLIVYFILPGVISDRAVSIFEFESEEKMHSHMGRIEIWQNTWRFIKESWFFGLGPGEAGSVDLKMNPDNPLLAHNAYLNMWAQFGVLFLALFIFMATMLLKTGINAVKKIKNIYYKNLALGITATIFALLIAGFFGDVFELTASIMYFWMYSGMIMILNRDVISQKGMKK